MIVLNPRPDRPRPCPPPLRVPSFLLFVPFSFILFPFHSVILTILLCLACKSVCKTNTLRYSIALSLVPLALLPWFLTTACNSFTLVSRIELSVLTDRNAKAEQPCAYATDSLSNLLLSSTRLVPRGVIPQAALPA